MNASKRWSYHFVSGLECVKCRRKGDLTLYSFDGIVIRSEAYSIEQLREHVPTMDVWCSSCSVSITTKVKSEGRRRHKEDAAIMADIRVGTQIPSRYDTYILEHFGEITKRDLLDRIKDHPCMMCRKSYPNVVMEFYYPQDKRYSPATMIHNNFTVRKMIDELERSILVCANCCLLLEHRLAECPKERIMIDRNFLDVKETL